MSSLIIRHFGGLSLRAAEGEVCLPPDIPRSLLAFLSSHPGQTFCRSFLSERLWPDLPSARARRALSTAIWRLKHCRAVGACLTYPSRDTISLALPRSGWIDTMAFEHKVARAEKLAGNDDNVALRLVAQAITLYNGSAYSDVSDEWAVIERTRLENRFCDALYLAARLNERRRRFGSAERAARRLITFEPFREDARRILVHALWRSGNRALAQRMYTEYTAFLRRELGAEPGFALVPRAQPPAPVRRGLAQALGGPRAQAIYHLRAALAELENETSH